MLIRSAISICIVMYVIFTSLCMAQKYEWSTRLPDTGTSFVSYGDKVFISLYARILMQSDKTLKEWRPLISGDVAVAGQPGTWTVYRVLTCDSKDIVLLMEQIDKTNSDNKIDNKKYCLAVYAKNGTLRSIATITKPLSGRVKFYDTKSGVIVRGRKMVITRDGGDTWFELDYKSENIIRRASWVSEKNLVVFDEQNNATYLSCDVKENASSKMIWSSNKTGEGIYLKKYGSYIVSLTWDSVVLIDEKTGVVNDVRMTKSGAVAMEIVDSIIYARCLDGTVARYEVKEGKLVGGLIGQAFESQGMFSYNGNIYATGQNGQIYMYKSDGDKFVLFDAQFEVERASRIASFVKGLRAEAPQLLDQASLPKYEALVARIDELRNYVSEQECDDALSQSFRIDLHGEKYNYTTTTIEHLEKLEQLLVAKRRTTTFVPQVTLSMTSILEGLEQELTEIEKTAYAEYFHAQYQSNPQARAEYDKKTEFEKNRLKTAYLLEHKKLRQPTTNKASGSGAVTK